MEKIRAGMLMSGEGLLSSGHEFGELSSGYGIFVCSSGGFHIHGANTKVGSCD